MLALFRALARVGRAAIPLAGIAASGCFDVKTEEKGPADRLMGETWVFQAVTYDLGVMRGNAVAYGMGSIAVSGNDTLLVLSDTLPAGLGGLYRFGGECFYGVKWENPGACLADDSWAFAPASATRFSGAVRCDSGDPASESGTWFLDSGQTGLNVAMPGDTARFRIETLTESTLSLSETKTDTLGDCGPVVLKTIYSFTAR